MRDYTDLTSKYLKQNKTRTILTLIGIIVANSLFSSILTLFLSYRDLQIQNIKQSKGNYEVSFKQVDEVQLDRITHNAEIFDYGIERNLGIGQILNSKNTSSTEDKNPSIEIKSFDKQAFSTIFNDCFHLVQGRIPNKEDEIAIESRAQYLFKDKKIGDKISIDIPQEGYDNKANNRAKAYEIVGIYEERTISSDKINGISFLENYNATNKGFYNVYVNLKEVKDKGRAANNIAKDLKLNPIQDNPASQIYMNQELISLKNFKLSSLIKNKFVNQMILMFIIIIACCAAIIYNDFNISVIERIEQFGILRSIGATPVQIRKLVFREGLLMCVIAIPIGLVIGYFGLFGILEFIRKISGESNIIIKIKFYPIVILLCILLVLLTVLASILSPTLKAGKISPIEAVKSITEIKNNRVKRNGSRFFRALFKFEGELAYKNIRRVPKRFWITVSSLAVSMTLFIVYGTYTINVYKNIDIGHIISEADARLEKIDNNDFQEEDYKEISSLEGIDRIYKIANNPAEIIFPREYGNLNYEKITGNPLMVVKENENYIYAGNSIMSYYNNYGLEIAKKYLTEGTVDKSALDNMGVLLVRRSTYDYSTYKVGDKIVIPKIKGYQWGQLEGKYRKGEIKDKDLEAYDMNAAIKNNEFYSLTVVGIVSKDFLYENNNLGDGLDLIFTESVYKKINGNLDSTGILLKFKDKESRGKLFNYLNDKAAKMGCKYTDYFQKLEQEQAANLQQQVFIYCIIILIAFISIINIINSIGINIVIRRKEFASLQAIGMTKGQLTKMVLYEGIIHVIIASLVSIGLSSYLSMMILRAEGRKITRAISPEILFVTIIAALIITLIASWIPLRKLKKSDIVERLRMS